MSSFPANLGKRLSHVLVLGLIGATLCGCSSVTRPFKSSKHIDMSPFAENTINLLADIRHGMDARMMVYLREYADTPALVQLRTDWRAYRPMLRGIAAYSIAIVTLSKANLTEEQRSQKLADFLDELLRPVAEKPDSRLIISTDELDTMLADIRAQKNFLDALNAAQPLVDEIARFSHEYLDFLADQLEETRAALDRRVRDDHAASQGFYKSLVEAQNLGFGNLVLLREYRQGYDPDALAKLLERDPQLTEILPAGKDASVQDLAAIEERVLYRLERIRVMTEQVQPDLDLFRNKITELDDLSRDASNNFTKTRITVTIWSRAHSGLAQGIIDPARFDVMGIAKQALSSALPMGKSALGL